MPDKKKTLKLKSKNTLAIIILAVLAILVIYIATAISQRVIGPTGSEARQRGEQRGEFRIEGPEKEKEEKCGSRERGRTCSKDSDCQSCNCDEKEGVCKK